MDFIRKLWNAGLSKEKTKDVIRSKYKKWKRCKQV
ncbi:hypothetical protein DKM28_05210 [Methanosarcina mazei]|uniref:Uncharacterized protein n=1 Tax=Methanosarcina mazei TaxID=2209 RepID=A0A4P8R5F2_METMZ|nr:hypothetical protein DKM28_05210 [Methanosarcina mazei]QIB92795.1 hypothetical protein FQU78_08315 [Methanosarcina mazei]